MAAVRVGAVLLAGGESSRMGTPKPLLEWGPPAAGASGQTLIEYQIEQLKQLPADPDGASARIVVVLGAHADEVRPFVHKAGALAVINELYAEGRASSVRVGAAALAEDTQTVVVLNVDQPRPYAVIKRLVDEHRRTKSLITVPTHRGERGHPLVVDGSLLPELREVRESTQGLRAVLQRHEADVREVEFETPVVLLDMNRPDDYERARESYFEQVSR